MKKLLFLFIVLFAISCFTIADTIKDSGSAIADSTTILVETETPIEVLIESSWWDEFLATFLGTIATTVLVAAFLYAFFGIVVRSYFKTTAAVKYKSTTPNKFSLKYWLENNFGRKIITIAATIIMVFVTLRFPMEWFGVELSMMYAFCVGLCFDYVLDMYKKKAGGSPV